MDSEDVYQTQDSSETFCEEADAAIDSKLEEIRKSIISHIMHQTFMTKSQIKEYKQFLLSVLPRLSSPKRCFATKSLAQLEEIEKRIIKFEKKWFASQKCLTVEETELPCSLLTNVDFCSQQTQVDNTDHKQKETELKEVNNTSTKTAVTVEEDTTTDEQTITNERKIVMENLEKTVQLIRQFKINFLRDLTRSKPIEEESFNSTCTKLVSNEYKLSPKSEIKNKETIFHIQMEAKNWTTLN